MVVVLIPVAGAAMPCDHDLAYNIYLPYVCPDLFFFRPVVFFEIVLLRL